MDLADSGPQAKSPTILVINAGSSSVKFALIVPNTGERICSGTVDQLGSDQAELRVDQDSPGAYQLPGADHDRALAAIVQHIHALDARWHPVGVGHRIVHAGEAYAASVLITPQVIAAVEAVSPLAPLHTPPGLLGVRATQAAWPELPQVAVFDTAFHQSLPPHAFRYAVPERWYTDFGVRRYGFHGTSHRYVSRQAALRLARDPHACQLVVAHLGNGASATAVCNGASVDTTMGLTPLEGLVMGTRSGDVDPGLFGYLADVASLEATAVTSALNQESGMLGLSGVSNDMREIWAQVDVGNERAELATQVYVHRLAKAIGALATSLTRLDALVFTGGIGENDQRVRAKTVERLRVLGLAIDPTRNADNGRASDGHLELPGHPPILVISTDEETMIAQDAISVIAQEA